MVKDAQKFAEELGMELKLQHRDLTDQTAEDERIETPKIGDWIKKEVQSNRYKEIKKGKWQGKTNNWVVARWQTVRWMLFFMDVGVENSASVHSGRNPLTIPTTSPHKVIQYKNN